MRAATTILLYCMTMTLNAAFDFSDVAYMGQSSTTTVSNAIVTNAIAWYEGRNGGFTNDLSGHGLTLTSTDSGQVLVTNQVNGYPAVKFPAGVSASWNSAVTNAQPYTVFLVIKASPDAGAGFPFEVVTPQQQFRLGFFSINAGVDLNGGTLFPNTNYHYITATYSNNASYLRQDGVDIATGATGAGMMTGQELQQVSSFDIYVALWGFCTNLTRQQVTNIETQYIKYDYSL